MIRFLQMSGPRFWLATLAAMTISGCLRHKGGFFHLRRLRLTLTTLSFIRYVSRNSRLNTLPTIVFGNSSRNSTIVGTLYTA